MTSRPEPRWLSDDEQRAWRALIDGHQLLLGRLESDLRASHQMALVEYKLFVRLSEQPDRSMRMAQLADDIGVSRSRLTHIVSRCELRGYLERSSEADDRRGVNCRLTDRGFARLADAAPVHAGGVRDYLIDLLDDEEIATMERIFSKVLAEQHRLRGTGRGRSSRDES